MTRRKTERRRNALLAEAERAIRERYAEFDLCLADIAEDVGCSPRQLQRIFREVGGTSFRDHLLRVRMEAAHRLLSRKTGHWPVRKVARAVGYREASGLRQRFTRFYGYNPSAVESGSYDYDAAWRASEERHDLGLRDEQSWSALKAPIAERIEQAVRLAPQDPDILFMATLTLRPLDAGFPDLKKLIVDYQARLDRLGGPSDAILEIAGMSKDAYQRHRSSIAGTQ